MIYALIALCISNGLTAAGWAFSAYLDHQERRILWSASYAASGQQAAANRVIKPTPAEDRRAAKAEADLSMKIREAAAPYSALNPFGR